MELDASSKQVFSIVRIFSKKNSFFGKKVFFKVFPQGNNEVVKSNEDKNDARHVVVFAFFRSAPDFLVQIASKFHGCLIDAGRRFEILHIVFVPV